jgi:hypothetical protein
MQVPLYSFTFEVRPRPGNPDYGRILSRDVTIWIPSTAENMAAVEARKLVDRYGFDIARDTQVREWDVDGDRCRVNNVLGKIVSIVERDGYVFEIGPEFPPL